jgi:hypothetical protein
MVLLLLISGSKVRVLVRSPSKSMTQRKSIAPLLPRNPDWEAHGKQQRDFSAAGLAQSAQSSNRRGSRPLNWGVNDRQSCSDPFAEASKAVGTCLSGRS